MTKKDLTSFYEKRATEFHATLEEVRKKINLISNVRLIVAAVFLLLLYFGLKNTPLLYTLPVVLVLFVFLVQRHTQLFNRKIYLENILQIQKTELQVLAGDLSNLVNGSEFIDTHHPYTHDLDIFGEGSLFQFVNRSSTYSGKKFLAERLSGPLHSVQSIAEHQEAVKELASQTEFRHAIQAIGMEVEEVKNDREGLKAWLKYKPFIYGKKFFKAFLIAFPIFTLAILLLSVFIDGVFSFFVICAALQFGILGIYLKRVNEFHEYVSKKKNVLEKYAKLLHCIAQNKFSSKLMDEVKSRAGDGDKKIASLASLVGYLNARANLLTMMVNGVLLYDLNCLHR